MRKVTAAAVQMKCSTVLEENLQKAEKMVRAAAADGAHIILLPELFEREYFCQQRRYDFYSYAYPTMEHPAVLMGVRLGLVLEVVRPVRFFERDGNVFYNSLAYIDADGTLLGIYRKTHIPDDHFYQEKFYFTPGNTGFQVFDTKYGRIGAGICWDQWFPETARSLALSGAELIFYPTAIGSEPILGFFASATFTIRFFMPWIAKHLTEWQTLTAAFGFGTLSYFLFPLFESFYALCGVAFLLGLALGSSQPNVMSLLHTESPEGRVGEALGLRTMLINICHTTLPILFGAAGAAVGAGAVFFAVATLMGGVTWFTTHCQKVSMSRNKRKILQTRQAHT